MNNTEDVLEELRTLVLHYSNGYRSLEDREKELKQFAEKYGMIKEEKTLSERIKDYQKVEHQKQKAKLKALVDNMLEVTSEIKGTLDVLEFMENVDNN